MKRYKLKRDTPAFKAGTECYIEEAGNMVPCRGISYTIVHKDQLEKNPNILTDWFEEIEESTRWKPELGQKYYFLDSNGFVYNSIWSDDSIDSNRSGISNCFQTKEEAERAVEYLKALAVVRGDATSKFTRDRDNFYVYYDVISNHLAVGVSFYDLENGIFGLPYFATKDDAKRSIERHKNEWLTIFGVEDKNEIKK
jgi:hypothetical protein